MADNSFLHRPGEVHFSAYRPQDVEEAMTVVEDRAWGRVGALLAEPEEERTFESTALALAEATEDVHSVRSLVDHLARVTGGPWHAVNEMASEREARFFNRLRFHRGVYRAVLEVRDRPGYFASLSPPRQKYLAELVLRYERDGIALDAPQQAELEAVNEQLSAAEVSFTRNLSEAHDAAGLAVPDRAGLDGLSEEFIARCEREARARGQDGYWVDYNPPDFLYVMANCRARPTRRDLYRLHVSAAAGPNLAVAQEELALRRRLAKLLGYHDFADYALELRMAGDGATAAAFIDRLTELYRDAARAEHEELTAFARELEADPGLELEDSDVVVDSYYPVQLRGSRVGLEEEQLRDYFSLRRAVEVMFSTIGALYGIELRPVEAERWHDDVEVYEAWDGDAHLATIWCDWYARAGKGSGAWANSFYAAPRAGGRVEEPSLGSVTCNFPPPDSSGHSRLTVRDVETLWHEFGHCMHMTCNMSELRQHTSFNCRWDFIEAPSQIMENWVWQEEVLSRMAVHHATGEPLAPEVLEKLLENRRFRVASAAMRQFAFAAQDLGMHREYEGTSPEDLLRFYRGVRQKFVPVPLSPEDAYLCSFKHIFGGMYAAAYYSYKWAEAIEADLFSAFKPDGYLSREVGMRYRNEVLAPGAEREPDELIRAFLGRPTTPDAMLERDGIKVPS